jgi:hypothetical protein
MVVVLLQLARGRRRAWIARAFRILEEFRSWGMTEVFVLGVMVSYTKLAGMTTVKPGLALYALGGFLVAAALAMSSLEPRTVWEAAGVPEAAPPQASGGLTARRAGLRAGGPPRPAGPLRPLRRDPAQPETGQRHPHLGPADRLRPPLHPRQRAAGDPRGPTGAGA